MSNSLSDAFVVALASHENAPTADIAAPKKTRRKAPAIKADAKGKVTLAPKAKAEPKPNAEARERAASEKLLADARKRIAKYEADAAPGSNAPIWHVAALDYLQHFGREQSGARVLGLLFNDMFQHRMTGDLYGHLHWKSLDKSNSQYCEQGKVLWNDICEAKKALLEMHMKRPNVSPRDFDMPWKRIREAAFKAWPKPAGYGANPNEGKTAMELAKAPIQKVYLALCNQEVQPKKLKEAIKALADALISLGVDIVTVNEKITK